MTHLKISEFINFLLFDESFGYYKNKVPIGKAGDFITAPEISQIFGELTAAYLLQIFSIRKPYFSLVEMGAGRGLWLNDILQTINKLAANNNQLALDFLSRSSFHIIEINPKLIKIQQEQLRQFTISWHQNFDEFLTCQKGEIYFISNELFDCFAIDQFLKTDIGWCERMIDLIDDFMPDFIQETNFSENKNLAGEPEFISDEAIALKPNLNGESNSIRCRIGKNLQQKIRFITADFKPQIHHFIEEKLCSRSTQTAPFGAIFEYSKSAQNFMQNLCLNLVNKGGIAINFDYGYFSYDFANSLQAIKNHRKIPINHSRIIDLIDADLTSHVDFGQLSQIAVSFGLQCSNITQREFLINLGIEERSAKLIAQNPDFGQEISSATQRMIGLQPEEMGELFKCQILWK